MTNEKLFYIYIRAFMVQHDGHHCQLARKYLKINA